MNDQRALDGWREHLAKAMARGRGATFSSEDVRAIYSILSLSQLSDQRTQDGHDTPAPSEALLKEAGAWWEAELPHRERMQYRTTPEALAGFAAWKLARVAQDGQAVSQDWMRDDKKLDEFVVAFFELVRCTPKPFGHTYNKAELRELLATLGHAPQEGKEATK